MSEGDGADGCRSPAADGQAETVVFHRFAALAIGLEESILRKISWVEGRQRLALAAH